MKKVVAKMIWKICGINWRIGNLVMDVIGYDNYLKIMRLQKK